MLEAGWWFAVWLVFFTLCVTMTMTHSILNPLVDYLGYFLIFYVSVYFPIWTSWCYEQFCDSPPCVLRSLINYKKQTKKNPKTITLFKAKRLQRRSQKHLNVSCNVPSTYVPLCLPNVFRLMRWWHCIPDLYSGGIPVPNYTELC